MSDYIMANLKAVRRGLGLTLADVGRGLYADKSTIVRWEEPRYAHCARGRRLEYRNWLEARLDERMKQYFAILNGDYDR